MLAKYQFYIWVRLTHIPGKGKFQERTVTFLGAVSPIIPRELTGNKLFSRSLAKMEGLGWNSQHVQQGLPKDKGLETKLNDP